MGAFLSCLDEDEESSDETSDNVYLVEENISNLPEIHYEYENRNEFRRNQENIPPRRHQNKKYAKYEKKQERKKLLRLIICKVNPDSNILNIPEFSNFPKDTIYTKKSVIKNTSEYSYVSEIFKSSGKPFMKITRIENITNPYLKILFYLKKLELEQEGNVTEKFLFHGTHLHNAPSICANNFNWRLCGSSVGTKYGQGISLSPISYYATHYCDKDSEEKIMFLCRVLVGNEHIGNKFTKIPNEGFDTTRNEKGDVIVKYDDDTVYPEYIIYFVMN